MTVGTFALYCLAAFFGSLIAIILFVLVTGAFD